MFPDNNNWNKPDSNRLYSSLKEVWGQDPVREITEKIKLDLFKKEDNVSEIDLLSEEPDEEVTHAYFPSEDFNSTYAQAQKKSIGNKCSHSVKHMKECKHCYKKLSKIIDSEVEKRCSALILETKLKEVQTSSTKPVKNNNTTLLIILIAIGIMILITLIILILKK